MSVGGTAPLSQWNVGSNVKCIAVSHDGARVVSGSDDYRVRVWDVHTGTLVLGPLEGHTGRIWSVAWSKADNRIISGSDDCTIRIWDACTGAPIGEPLRGHTGPVHSVAFLPHSTHIVSGSSDQTIRTWDAHTGTPIGEPLKGHTDPVHSVAFSPNSNLIVSGSGDNTICVWEGPHSTTSFNISIPQNVPTFDRVTSEMSIQETFECLVEHGCVDMTSSIDSNKNSYPVIAAGGFGDVRRVALDNGTLVAVKTLRLSLLGDDDKALKRAVREVYIWSRLRHPNIQDLLGIIVFQGGLGMISPWMQQGDLKKYIARHPDTKRYPLCAQLASGVSYLHSIDMVHGDIKASNVLVSDNGTLKINDFDYAILPDTPLQFSTTTRNGGGTLRWMAPELFQPEVKANQGENQALSTRNKKTDVYALGMTMLEIITGNVPYSEHQGDMGIFGAIFNKTPPRRPEELPDSDEQANRMWELLLKCWDHDPSVRPDALSVWISASIEWRTLHDLPYFDDWIFPTSAQEIFDLLVKHGCPDLSSVIDPAQYSSPPVSSGWIVNTWQARTKYGFVVEVKCLLRTSYMSNKASLQHIPHRLHNWSKARHENIQELLGVVMFQGQLGMVSAWMTNGRFAQYTENHPGVDRYPLCIQVARGIAYMHSIGMVHGGLRAANILVSAGGIVKIRIWLDNRPLLGNLLDYEGFRWRAPELLIDKDDEGLPVTCNKKTDIYALGMTMLEIISGKVPYWHVSGPGIFGELFRKQLPKRPQELSGPDERTTQTWLLLLKCWDHNPSVRPDASSVLKSLQAFAT